MEYTSAGNASEKKQKNSVSKNILKTKKKILKKY